MGPNTVFALTQPFLNDTHAALIRRGARHVQAPFPFGEEGTTAWLAAIAAEWNVPADLFAQVTDAPRARARKAIAQAAEALNGKTVFLMPDSQLEIPLARFLTRECGMRAIEVGSPYNPRRPAWPRPRPAARRPADQRRPGRGETTRPRPRRPAGPDGVWALAWPIRWRRRGLRRNGQSNSCSHRSIFYEQAGDLAGLFSRPLRRKSLLRLEAAE